MESDKNPTKSGIGWFSTLSEEQQIRYAPTYISIILQQLAQAEDRYKRLEQCCLELEELQTLQGSRGGLRACRKCLDTSEASEVRQYSLVECAVWGCSKCNFIRGDSSNGTAEKLSSRGVFTCGGCDQSFCERCDNGILKLSEEFDSYACFACNATENIISLIQENQWKLGDYEATRNEAIIKWSLSKYAKSAGLEISETKSRWIAVNHVLQESIKAGYPEWVAAHYTRANRILETDFPELLSEQEEVTFIIFPEYYLSMDSCSLVDDLAEKFLSEVFEKFLLGSKTGKKFERIKEKLLDEVIWPSLKSPNSVLRNSLTVEELVEQICEDYSDPYINSATAKKIKAEFPEFFERVFN